MGTFLRWKPIQFAPWPYCSVAIFPQYEIKKTNLTLNASYNKFILPLNIFQEFETMKILDITFKFHISSKTIHFC